MLSSTSGGSENFRIIWSFSYEIANSSALINDWSSLSGNPLSELYSRPDGSWYITLVQHCTATALLQHCDLWPRTNRYLLEHCPRGLTATFRHLNKIICVSLNNSFMDQRVRKRKADDLSETCAYQFTGSCRSLDVRLLLVFILFLSVKLFAALRNRIYCSEIAGYLKL